MSDEAPKLPNTMEDAERFQHLFVTPLVEAVKTEMQIHAADVQKAVDGFSTKVSNCENRISNLEQNQRKALVGWGVLTLAVGTIVTACGEWVKKKLHWTG